VFELGVLGLAAAQGWLPEKLQAYGSVVSLRRAIRAHRRQVQSLRRCSDRELRRFFEPRLVSPFLPALPARLAGAVTAAYLRLV
jgi:hypothetical protein